MKPTQNMFVDDPVEEKPTTPKKQTKTTKPKTKMVETPVDEEVKAPKPANILDLPSKGQFGYPESVQYRDMLAKDEEILASSTAENYARTLNGVLKSVLMDCEFYEDLCVHDRDYALIWLWANNYSPRKTLEITCGSCGNEDKHNIDLTALDVVDPKENFTGAFTLPLKNGEEVKVRLNTVGDELNAEKYMLKNKQHRYEYLMLVLSIDVGVPMMLDTKIEWVGNNITAHEMAIIKEFHRQYAYGVKTRLEHTCSACGEVTPFDLPFSVEDILNPTVQFNFEEYV
jgi:hypothetical protein